MSNQENILQQAKSGNPNAISMLLNKSLTAKGITIVKHDLKDNCLTLVLESDKSFNSATQSKIVNFIESNLVKLDVSGISSVVVCGKVTNADNYSWQKDFSLVSGFDDIPVDDNVESSTNDDVSSNSTSASDVNTEDSYTDDKLSSVKKVLDLALLHKNITCKVSLEDRCLRVVLESVKLDDKESCINAVKRQINYLKVEGADSVNVYGMKEGDSIPVWSESIDLINQIPQSNVVNNKSSVKGKDKWINLIKKFLYGDFVDIFKDIRSGNISNIFSSNKNIVIVLLLFLVIYYGYKGLEASKQVGEIMYMYKGKSTILDVSDYIESLLIVPLMFFYVLKFILVDFMEGIVKIDFNNIKNNNFGKLLFFIIVSILTIIMSQGIFIITMYFLSLIYKIIGIN